MHISRVTFSTFPQPDFSGGGVRSGLWTHEKSFTPNYIIPKNVPANIPKCVCVCCMNIIWPCVGGSVTTIPKFHYFYSQCRCQALWNIVFSAESVGMTMAKQRARGQENLDERQRRNNEQWEHKKCTEIGRSRGGRFIHWFLCMRMRSVAAWNGVWWNGKQWRRVCYYGCRSQYAMRNFNFGENLFVCCMCVYVSLSLRSIQDEFRSAFHLLFVLRGQWIKGNLIAKKQKDGRTFQWTDEGNLPNVFGIDFNQLSQCNTALTKSRTRPNWWWD